MHVLFLLDMLSRGGAETQALDVCRNAKRFGIDLTVATAQGGALEDEFKNSGAEFVKLARKFPVDPFLVFQLRKLIKEKAIEIVHSYQAVDALHLYFATLGLKGVKQVLSFQGFIADKKNLFASRFLIPRMDANLVVSRGLHKWIGQVDKLDTNSFQLLYNGADPLRLQPTGRNLKRELGLRNEDLLCGMIANFYRDPRKDQLTICKSLPEVFQKVSNAHFVFVGKTEFGAEEKLRECVEICKQNGIADRVHFPGSRDDIPDVLAALDVFVFSSLHEGLPVAATEAMVAGVPMIVSDIEPLREVSGEGKYAEVFRTGDEKHLAEKLTKMLVDKNGRDKLARRAREFALKNFSIDAHLKRLIEIYAQLVTWFENTSSRVDA